MMRKISIIAAVSLSILALSATGSAQQISGDYVETRSADVYTGPCVANGEAGLAGDQAILAWRVKKGEWDGISLDGLSVLGVVKANATLGDPYGNPYPVKAVLIIDEKASAEQQKALASFAKKMGGELLSNIVRVERASISMSISHAGGHYSKAIVRAGDLAGIETRALNDNDHFCGNEETFYKPLAEMSHAMPAVAELDRFAGKGLGVSWTVHGKRSAFVGSFTR